MLIFPVSKDTWGFHITSLICNPVNAKCCPFRSMDFLLAAIASYSRDTHMSGPEHDKYTVLCCELGGRQEGYRVTCARGCQVVMKRTLWSREAGTPYSRTKIKDGAVNLQRVCNMFSQTIKLRSISNIFQ